MCSGKTHYGEGARLRKIGSSRSLPQRAGYFCLADWATGILAAINGVVKYVRGLPLDLRISLTAS